MSNAKTFETFWLDIIIFAANHKMQTTFQNLSQPFAKSKYNPIKASMKTTPFIRWSTLMFYLHILRPINSFKRTEAPILVLHRCRRKNGLNHKIGGTPSVFVNNALPTYLLTYLPTYLPTYLHSYKYFLFVCSIMELLRWRGLTGLPDNFPIQQKDRLFCYVIFLILFKKQPSLLLDGEVIGQAS